MELQRGEMNYGMVLQGLLVGASLLIVGSVRVQSDSQFVSKPVTQQSSPVAGRLFACLESWPETQQKNRVAVLHGPDWVLQSSIKPACFPEREVIFSAEIGKQFLPHSITARTRLWVTKIQDVTHIRIVESSGIERQDTIAVSIVTNHRCIDRNGNHCSVKGGATLVRID